MGDNQGSSPISGLKTLLSEPIGFNSDTPNPYVQLDSLYTGILSQAVGNLKSARVEYMKIVVGTVIQLHSEMLLEAIVHFLGDNENMVEMTLNQQQSEGVETLLKPIEKVDSVSKDTVLHMIPQEVQYACRFWALHVTFSSIDNSDEELMERLDRFSSTMLL